MIPPLSPPSQSRPKQRSGLTARGARVALAALALLGPLTAACTNDSSSTKADDTRGDASSTSSGSSTATTAPQAGKPVEGTSGDFYAVPDPLPTGGHGTLLRFQEVTPSPIEGAKTFRIMYLSRSLAGDNIAVTGTALVPTVPAGPDGRRMLTIAHGTTGIADECAPSKEPGSEILLMSGPMSGGWLVAMSDYEGLGTPGRHPYLVGPSEGRSVIDAILAARSLPGADAGDQLAIAGYSQGGHGALWANEVAADWAPEVNVVGTFAGAPATELDVILAAAPNIPALSGFAFMMVAGFKEAYPDADLSTLLTPAGEEALDRVDKGCVGDVMSSFSDAGDEPLIRADGPASPEWKKLTTDSNPGSVVTADPVLIIHSEADDVVPVALSAMLNDRMCRIGQAVERRVVDRGGHGAAAPSIYLDALDWLSDRFEGTPAPASTCPT